MMRSAVKCAAAVRVPGLPLNAQPQVSTQNSLMRPFASGLFKTRKNIEIMNLRVKCSNEKEHRDHESAR